MDVQRKILTIVIVIKKRIVQIEARKHLGCSSLVGIETDSVDKIHLNEYVYGVSLVRSAAICLQVGCSVCYICQLIWKIPWCFNIPEYLHVVSITIDQQ